MTTEEKAKAYDEALDKFKKFKEKYFTYGRIGFGDVLFDKTGTAQDELDAIFPELKEPEEERIRKIITDSVFCQYGADAEYKDVLDYLDKLEKQKGRNPDSLIYDKDLDKAAREFYLSGGADSPVDSTGLVPIVRMAEFGATWMKERMEKEQKPEWSEEDVDMLNSCISSIEEAKENRYAYKETDGDTSYDHEIAWLKSLRPSWRPSEEQMEELNKVRTLNPGLDALYWQLKNM